MVDSGALAGELPFDPQVSGRRSSAPKTDLSDWTVTAGGAGARLSPSAYRTISSLADLPTLLALFQFDVESQPGPRAEHQIPLLHSHLLLAPADQLADLFRRICYSCA